MIQEPSKRASVFSRRSFAYGTMVVICSLAVTFLLLEFGCETIPALAVSLFSVVLVLSRWWFFGMIVPPALFYAFVFGGLVMRDVPTTGLTLKSGAAIVGQLVSDDDRAASSDVTARVVNTDSMMVPEAQLILLSLLLLACTFRFCECYVGETRSGIVTSRWNFTPVAPSSSRRFGLHGAEFISLVLISVALGISTVLSSPVYEQLRSGPQVGLIPEAYFAIKIVLLMAVLVGLSRGALSYASMVVDGGRLASLQLRHELWKSNGTDERRIVRQMKKNQN